MRIFYGYKRTGRTLHSPVAAIGIFDGIHIGHQKILKDVIKKAGKKHSKVVITFDPHPGTVLNPRKKVPRIMTMEHRISILKTLGFDAVMVIRFTKAFAAWNAEKFIKRILVPLNIKEVYVGNNFSLGREKASATGSLRSLCLKHGIKMTVIPNVKEQARIVSSTLIRNLIQNGGLAGAEKLLDRYVSVLGTVVAGDRRGRRFGIPTANIDPHHEVIPPQGVYAVKVSFDGRLYDGVVNIGFRPTFFGRFSSKREEPTIEVYILDYRGNLYGKHVEIFFIERLRPERKFKDPEALVKQIKIDIADTKGILKNVSSKLLAHRY